MLVQQHVRLFPSNRINRRFTCASLPKILSLQFQVIHVALTVDGIRVAHAAWQAEDIANFQGALKPLATNGALADYNVGKGGKLVGYRWDGEPTLREKKFHWLGGRLDARLV